MVLAGPERTTVFGSSDEVELKFCDEVTDRRAVLARPEHRGTATSHPKGLRQNGYGSETRLLHV